MVEASNAPDLGIEVAGTAGFIWERVEPKNWPRVMIVAWCMACNSAVDDELEVVNWVDVNHVKQSRGLPQGWRVLGVCECTSRSHEMLEGWSIKCHDEWTGIDLYMTDGRCEEWDGMSCREDILPRAQTLLVMKTTLESETHAKHATRMNLLVQQFVFDSH